MSPPPLPDAPPPEHTPATQPSAPGSAPPGRPQATLADIAGLRADLGAEITHVVSVGRSESAQLRAELLSQLEHTGNRLLGDTRQRHRHLVVLVVLIELASMAATLFILSGGSP